MKKIRLLFCGLIVVGSLSLTSCATILGKSSYPLSVNTNPTGADIYVTNQKGYEVFRGRTPANVMLKSSGGYMRSETYKITLNYPGYNTYQFSISSKMNGWYWANILLGGIIGMLVVDPLTGAMYKLDNAPVNIVMQKYSSGNVSQQNQLNIVDIKDVPEDLKVYLVKLN